MESIKWRLGYECGVFIGCEGIGRARSSGVALLWKRQVNVILLNYSLYHIDMEIRDTTEWRFKGLYGWPRTANRKYTWDLLKSLRDRSELPWLCGGDINEIISSEEKRGGVAVPGERKEAFLEAVNFCNLREVPQEGLQFTWLNGRISEENIECMLDRYLANADWWDIYPASHSEALPRIASDHNPILCRVLKEPIKPRSSRRFRFEEMWMRYEGCPNLIQLGWNDCPEGASFGERSKRCAIALKKWEKQEFGQVKHQIQEIERAIVTEQARPLSEESKAAIELLLTKREEIRAREEVMWAQWSRVLWLKEGDHNTKYFHKSATYQKQRNRIEGIQNSEGIVVKEEVGIQEVFRNFYASLFSSGGSVRVEEITRKVIPKITTEM